MQKLLVSLFLTAFLAGCSGFPGVYKIDIPQGNVITQEMVDQLKPGLTKRQVRFVMGSPLLEDSFHNNRWDYIYTLQKGDGSYVKQQLRLFFEGDKLSSLNGDFRPSPTN